MKGHEERKEPLWGRYALGVRDSETEVRVTEICRFACSRNSPSYLR